MSRNTKFVSDINEQDLDLLMFFNFFIAFVGSIFLAWNEVQAGLIYAFMFLGIVCIMFLMFFFLKDDDELKPITEYVRIPFSSFGSTLTAVFYLIGLVLPIIVQFVLSLTTKAYTAVSFSVPLFGADIRSGVQSFSAARIGESMPWKLFTVMFTAGNGETFVYNFGTVLIGALIGIWTLKLLNDGKDLPFMRKRTFVLLFAFGMSVLLFALSHLMNSTYDLQNFIIASLFLLVSNISIYLGGVFLALWAGYHQTNNLLWLIQEEGLREVINGFISWFGLLYLIYLALLIWYVLRNGDRVSAEFRRWTRNLFG